MQLGSIPDIITLISPRNITTVRRVTPNLGSPRIPLFATFYSHKMFLFLLNLSPLRDNPSSFALIYSFSKIYLSIMKAIKTIANHQAQIQDVPLPTLRDGYILVKVNAIALNPTDW
jgi:hypothetical protein